MVRGGYHHIARWVLTKGIRPYLVDAFRSVVAGHLQRFVG